MIGRIPDDCGQVIASTDRLTADWFTALYQQRRPPTPGSALSIPQVLADPSGELEHLETVITEMVRRRGCKVEQQIVYYSHSYRGRKDSATIRKRSGICTMDKTRVGIATGAK